MEYQKRAWFAAITQNTGAHFLDSGSAYGRHWQRNASLDRNTAFDWDYRLDVQSYGWDVSINVLHYLTSNYVIDRDATKRFHKFALSSDMDGMDWGECLEAWVEKIGGETGRSDNTYNHDNWLTQEVLTHSFTDGEGEEWIAVRVHTGADVRGGYSRPYLCKADDHEWNVWLTDGWLCCNKGHRWYADGPSHWICDDPYKTFPDDDFKVRFNGKAYWLACPLCGRKVNG